MVNNIIAYINYGPWSLQSANIDELVATILQKWLQSHPSADDPPKKGLDIDVNAQLAKLLEQQKLQPAVNKEREYTEEERRIKQQILAQYSQVAIHAGQAADSRYLLLALK